MLVLVGLVAALVGIAASAQDGCCGSQEPGDTTPSLVGIGVGGATIRSAVLLWRGGTSRWPVLAAAAAVPVACLVAAGRPRTSLRRRRSSWSAGASSPSSSAGTGRRLALRRVARRRLPPDDRDEDAGVSSRSELDAGSARVPEPPLRRGRCRPARETSSMTTVAPGVDEPEHRVRVVLRVVPSTKRRSNGRMRRENCAPVALEDVDVRVVGEDRAAAARVRLGV